MNFCSYFQYVIKTGSFLLQIRNECVVQLAAKLVAIRGGTKTEAVFARLKTSSPASRAKRHSRSECGQSKTASLIGRRRALKPTRPSSTNSAANHDRCRRLRHRRDPDARTRVRGSDRTLERADRAATSPIAILMKRRSDCGGNGVVPSPKQRPTSWSFSASPMSRWWRSSSAPPMAHWTLSPAMGRGRSIRRK